MKQSTRIALLTIGALALAAAWPFPRCSRSRRSPRRSAAGQPGMIVALVPEATRDPPRADALPPLADLGTTSRVPGDTRSDVVRYARASCAGSSHSGCPQPHAPAV